MTGLGALNAMFLVASSDCSECILYQATDPPHLV